MLVQVSDDASWRLARSEKSTYSAVALDGELWEQIPRLHVLNVVVLKENAFVVRDSHAVLSFSFDDVERVYHRHGLMVRPVGRFSRAVKRLLRRDDCGCK